MKGYYRLLATIKYGRLDSKPLRSNIDNPLKSPRIGIRHAMSVNVWGYLYLKTFFIKLCFHTNSQMQQFNVPSGNLQDHSSLSIYFLPGENGRRYYVDTAQGRYHCQNVLVWLIYQKTKSLTIWLCWLCVSILLKCGWR